MKIYWCHQFIILKQSKRLKNPTNFLPKLYMYLIGNQKVFLKCLKYI